LQLRICEKRNPERALLPLLDTFRKLLLAALQQKPGYAQPKYENKKVFGAEAPQDCVLLNPANIMPRLQ
jgi:hypothetical protein